MQAVEDFRQIISQKFFSKTNFQSLNVPKPTGINVRGGSIYPRASPRLRYSIVDPSTSSNTFSYVESDAFLYVPDQSARIFKEKDPFEDRLAEFRNRNVNPSKDNDDNDSNKENESLQNRSNKHYNHETRSPISPNFKNPNHSIYYLEPYHKTSLSNEQSQSNSSTPVLNNTGSSSQAQNQPFGSKTGSTPSSISQTKTLPAFGSKAGSTPSSISQTKAPTTLSPKFGSSPSASSQTKTTPAFGSKLGSTLSLSSQTKTSPFSASSKPPSFGSLSRSNATSDLTKSQQ